MALDNVYAGYLTATQQGLYSNTVSTLNTSTEPVKVNIWIINTHSDTLQVTISILSDTTESLTKTAGVPIFRKTMATGEVATILDKVINSGQVIVGVAGTTNLATVHIDLI